MFGERRPRFASLQAVFRLLAVAALVLTNFHAVVVTAFDCCTASALATAVSDEHQCCGGDSHAESESDGHCPCPLPCAPGCSGHGLRAVAGVASGDVAPAAVEVIGSDFGPERRPPAPDRPGILHVPKPFRV
ncbi:MAG TPA: hypothetical protein VM686_22785 [Polyangiaceae bacterium]|nr:hypothetical protein [Polyangiaceae bacterium]